jgi:hypothetical protein
MKRHVDIKFWAAFSLLCFIAFLLVQRCDVTVEKDNVSKLRRSAELQAKAQLEVGFELPAKRSESTRSPKPEVTDEAVDRRDLRDKTWRRTNHLITQYRPDIDERLMSLSARKAAADDPDVVQLARDVIDPVPDTTSAGIKRAHGIVKTPQAAEVANTVSFSLCSCVQRKLNRSLGPRARRQLALCLVAPVDVADEIENAQAQHRGSDRSDHLCIGEENGRTNLEL